MWRAQAFLEEGMVLCREVGAQQLLGITLHNLAHTALKQQHCEEALEYGASSLSIYQQGTLAHQYPNCARSDGGRFVPANLVGSRRLPVGRSGGVV